jgi:single-stranded-DNA-specific exonuclease
MKVYEPYGQGNRRPKFITKGVTIKDVKSMGKEKEHRRFLFFKNGISHRGVLFKTKQKFNIGEKADIIYTINENHFNNRVTIQLMVEEISLY